MQRDVIRQYYSYKGISLSIIEDLHAYLVNERGENHDSLWSIHHGHDDKIKD